MRIATRTQFASSVIEAFRTVTNTFKTVCVSHLMIVSAALAISCQPATASAALGVTFTTHKLKIVYFHRLEKKRDSMTDIANESKIVHINRLKTILDHQG